MTNQHPSMSVVQSEVEAYVLRKLGLKKRKISLGKNVSVEVDGVGKNYLVEIVARIGSSASRDSSRYKKVITDACKLFLVGELAEFRKHKKQIIFCDPNLEAKFRESSKWHAKAMARLGVDTRVVALPANLKKRLLSAQRKQGERFRG